MNDANQALIHKVFQFSLPYNFDENNKEFDIFKIHQVENYHNSIIKKYSNVRIATNSVVFNYFNIFRETCISQNVYEKYQKGYKFFFKYIFPQINFYRRKKFILITDEWTTNYYHWHLIALNRLLVFKQNNLLEDTKLLLPKRYKKLKFILDSLKKFGIDEKQIIYLGKKSNIKVKEIFCPLIYQNHPQAFNEIKSILTKDISGGLNLGDKIYISREACALRFVENEGLVVALLEKYGFKKVVMEQYSYQDQMAICHNARYVVGPHGAGLTNILFMKKGGFLLELATKPDSNKLITDYYKMANFTEINYLYQECEAAGETRDFHHGSLIVDLEKLEKNLQLMLK
jgi:capsular polysaccharide biosynthesis protein